VRTVITPKTKIKKRISFIELNIFSARISITKILN
jgi:hypothetical protein